MGVQFSIPRTIYVMSAAIQPIQYEFIHCNGSQRSTSETTPFVCYNVCVSYVHVSIYAYLCVCASVRACVRACVHECLCVCVCESHYTHPWLIEITIPEPDEESIVDRSVTHTLTHSHTHTPLIVCQWH